MKFERTEVWGFEHAIRGMRNPMNSWGKSDSGYEYIEQTYNYLTCKVAYQKGAVFGYDKLMNGIVTKFLETKTTSCAKLLKMILL